MTGSSENYIDKHNKSILQPWRNAMAYFLLFSTCFIYCKRKLFI